MTKQDINDVMKFAPEPNLIEDQSNGLVKTLTSVVSILNHISKLIESGKLDKGYIEAIKNEILKNIHDYNNYYQYDSGINAIVKIEIERFFAEVRTLFSKQ